MNTDNNNFQDSQELTNSDARDVYDTDYSIYYDNDN